MKITNIRNFSIVAHVDHGKSTLANLFLNKSNSSSSSSGDSFLYRFSLEEKKGITFKLHSIQLVFFLPSFSQNFVLNLIDTPGHVEFKNEVLLSLTVCEGIILLVDAVKGIQSQTLFYYGVAKKLGLSVLPVINKIDLPLARVSEVCEQLQKLLGCEKEEIILISAKTEHNFEVLLENVISRIPSPVSKC